MRFLSFIVLIVSLLIPAIAQSPHGDNFKVNCSSCHQTESWRVEQDSVLFDHNKETSFNLTGQHLTINCRSCHSGLIFNEATSDCFSCHKDIHQNSVGQDCERCHTSETWIIRDITSLHQSTRFPLVGVHLRSDCIQCHTSYNNFVFESLGITCFECHSGDYFSANAPNHVAAGFSTNCDECHGIADAFWTARNFNHDFFPLTGGHNIQNCFACHQAGGNYSGLSTACYSCHSINYASAVNPNHAGAGISTECQNCHVIVSWIPSTFDHITSGFELSGKHIPLECSSCHKGTTTGITADCFT